MRRTLFLIVVIASTTGMALAAGARPQSTIAGRSSRGGGGVVRTGGRVGRLRIDRSLRGDVIRVVGDPDADRIGTFYAPGAPNFEALGYQCGRRRRDTSQVTYYHGPWCVTVFYLNESTGRLAAFFTGSSRYRGPAGIRPGMAANIAERRMRLHATGGGCGYNGVRIGGGGSRDVARLHVNVNGGQLVSIGPKRPYRLVGGTVGSFSLESNRDPIGLLFC